MKMLIKINSRLRGLVEVSSVLVSTESLVSTLNCFQPFLVFQWSVNYTFFRHNSKPGKQSHLKLYLLFTLTETSLATTSYSYEFFFFWSVNYANLVLSIVLYVMFIPNSLILFQLFLSGLKIVLRTFSVTLAVSKLYELSL